jgi:CRP/FNR family transcriptional regulator, cyclic AMP receptor protein
VRRIGRRQRDFSEDTLARTIIAKWPWTDTPAPRTLHDAFLIHTVRSKVHEADERDAVLTLYKDAVRESVNSGVISRTDVRGFDKVRSRLHITDADHERIMSELVDEDRALTADGATLLSPEKRLQLEGYTGALAASLDLAVSTGRAVDDAVIQQLRQEYAVTTEEHRLVLDSLVQRREGVASYILKAPAGIEELDAAIRALERSTSPVTAFLSRLLRRRWTRTADTLIQALGSGDQKAPAWREALLSSDPARRQAAVAELASRLSPATAARLTETFTKAVTDRQTDLVAALRTQLRSTDPYIRATAVYVLQSQGATTDADRQLLANDDHPLVRETLQQERRIADARASAEPSTLEKMIALRSVQLFDALEPEDLIRLAQSSTEVWFTQGEALCHEDDVGDEAFVLLAGEVSVFKRDAGTDRLVGVEGVGTCIGELSVLDPAPRASTVIVSSVAARALRLNGQALRNAREASPALSDGIIRLLVRRLRGDTMRAAAVTPEQSERR